MEKFSHRNIVKLFTSFSFNDDSDIFIIMEKCDKDLNKLVQDRNGVKIPIETVLDYCCQILSGVKYMHSSNIIHRDIKPQVILKFETNDFKLF